MAKNNKKSKSSSSKDIAMNFFLSKGYTKQQAAGIVGNLMVESGDFDPNVISGKIKGDSGAAVGIAQWHPDRQAKFKNKFGKSIIGSSLEEQLEFVHHELNNNEKSAGSKLKNTKSAQEAASILDQFYERSSGAHRDKRMKNAAELAGEEYTGQSRTTSNNIYQQEEEPDSNSEQLVAGFKSLWNDQDDQDEQNGESGQKGQEDSSDDLYKLFNSEESQRRNSTSKQNTNQDFINNLFKQLRAEEETEVNQSAYGGYSNSNQYENGGNLNEFNEGGTHEENPLGGIPVGMGTNGKPNTVEEGESSYKFKDGSKYIFSNRIIIN